MPSKKSEIVVPVKESDEFWDNFIKERSKKQPSAVPPPSVSLPDAETGEPNVPPTIDPEVMKDPKKQHEFLDSFRSTDGIDYEQLRREAIELVALRKELESKKRISDYRKIGKERYPHFVKRFPQFFDSIRTVEANRLNEFLNVMHMMLTKLSQVKSNVLTHTEMRNEVFEKNLARKYYRSK